MAALQNGQNGSARLPRLTAKDVLSDGLSKRLLLVACAMILIGWSILAVDLWRIREQRIEHAGEQAASLARAVEQRITRTLRVTDQVLRLVREEIKVRKIGAKPGALTPLLEGLTPNIDEILTVSFINPEGINLAQSNPTVPVGLRYAGSDFYLFHTGNVSDELYIEKPIIGPASGLRVFTMSRAVRKKNGELLGIINASVRADVIASEFDEIRIGKRGSIGFHHLPSYLVVARQPDYEKTFAQGLEHRGLQEALGRSPVGIFAGEISADRIQRLFAYRKIDGLPLAVTVGIARTDILETLGKELASYLAVMLALTLAIIGGTLLLLNARHREIMLRRDIAEKDSLFRAFFEAVPAGMCTLDREMRYRLVNPSLARINGIGLDDYQGKTVAEVHPALLNKLKII